MKRVCNLLIFCLLAVSCGPSKHAVHVEMRHPSKSGVELSGKNISVVFLENDNMVASDFNASMADAFAYTLEQNYGSEIGVYRMRSTPGANYSKKDTLFNILMDTGADLVFLFDTVAFGNLNVGAPSKLSKFTSPDSTHLSISTVPFTLKLYCYDAMNKEDKVQLFGGTSMLNPKVYSKGNDDSTLTASKAYNAIGETGWDAGLMISESFMPQWKHEQYSIVYYDSQKWYDALLLAENCEWKAAMDIWLNLLNTNDLMKRSCAAFNLSVATFMLGDYHLAKEWLDRSDEDNKLPISDAMRKRIQARISN